MARPCFKSSKATWTYKLKNLSSEVLLLLLQILNLPITGSHARMLERLRLVTMDGCTNIQACDGVRSPVSLQNRLMQRLTVLMKTGSQMSTQQWKNCSRTTSRLSARQETVSFSVNKAFHCSLSWGMFPTPLCTPSPCALGTATPSLAWLTYNEQFRCCTAYDLSKPWDKIDL